MTVREYKPEDFEAVCEIYLDAKRAELRYEPGDFTFTPLNQDEAILAAFKESEIIVYENEAVLGFAATFNSQLRALFVRDGARGKGVGQSLLSAVLAKASGAITLNVARSNESAIRFYKRNGFALSGETIRQYSGINVRYAQMRHPGGVRIAYALEDDWQELKRVRLAALLDAPTAFGISHASAAAYTDQAWRDRAAGRGPARYILAFEDDVAVGIIAHVPDVNQELNLIAMWVSPEQRGTPTATRLVDVVKTEARKQDHPRILLGVASSNQRAVTFYQNQGFAFLPEWEFLESHPHIQVQKMAWTA